MQKSLWGAAIALGLTGCGDVAEPAPKPLGADPPAAPVEMSRFERNLVSGFAESPAVAVDAQGRRVLAFIPARGSWPRIEIGDATEELPRNERESAARSVSVAAGGDGSLHFAWDGGEKILYASRDAGGVWSELVEVGEAPSREPTIAVSASGEVVIAWTWDAQEKGPEEQPSKIMVARKNGERFRPRHANPGCCVGDYDDVAHRVSGPSLALGPDGEAHVVFEWEAFGSTVIDYVRRNGRGFTDPIEISNVAYAPCPAIWVDSAGGAHVTFLEEGNQDVWTVAIAGGEKGQRISLVDVDTLWEDGGWLNMAMPIRDGNGDLHLVLDGRPNGGDSALWYYSPQGKRLQITEVGSEMRPQLTPRNGGLAIDADGALLVPYALRESRDALAESWLAIGK